MQTIILKDNQSEHFELITYPDGQRSIRLHLDKLNVKEPVLIKCRLKKFSDLEVFYCLLSALAKNDFIIDEIEFLYLFGMRSDRAFEPGEPNYWFDVIKPLTQWNNLKTFILHPHSKKIINYSRNKVIDYNHNIRSGCLMWEYFTIGGDLSAIYNFPIADLYFNKKRKFDGIYVNLPDFETDKPILIVDDLCDGGATFIAEAKLLKERYPEKSLNLYVTHGLFTKGFDELLKYYDKIICTNSYQDINHPRVQQIKVI